MLSRHCTDHFGKDSTPKKQINRELMILDNDETISSLNHATTSTSQHIAGTRNGRLTSRSFLLIMVIIHVVIVAASAQRNDKQQQGGMSACSVCGEGSKVGNPDAIYVLPDEPIRTCGTLESAGEQGLISSEECISFSGWITDVCNCTFIADDNIAATKPPSMSPGGVVPSTAAPAFDSLSSPSTPCNICEDNTFEIVDPTAVIQAEAELFGDENNSTACGYIAQQANLGLIDADTRAILPALIDQFCGGCVTKSPATLLPSSPTQNNVPTSAPAPTSAPVPNIPPHRTFLADKQKRRANGSEGGFNVFLILLIVFLGGITVAMCCFTYFGKKQVGPSNRVLGEQDAVIRDGDGENNQHNMSSTAVGEETVSKEEREDPQVRRLVLSALFLEQKRGVNGESNRSSAGSGRDLLIYDSETNQSRYESGTETTCSICLEHLDPKYSVGSGLCSHVFHQDCILRWLLNKKQHDDCPNCRQQMWDPEKYQLVKEEILWLKEQGLEELDASA